MLIANIQTCMTYIYFFPLTCKINYRMSTCNILIKCDIFMPTCNKIQLHDDITISRELTNHVVNLLMNHVDSLSWYFITVFKCFQLYHFL